MFITVCGAAAVVYRFLTSTFAWKVYSHCFIDKGIQDSTLTQCLNLCLSLYGTAVLLFRTLSRALACLSTPHLESSRNREIFILTIYKHLRITHIQTSRLLQSCLELKPPVDDSCSEKNLKGILVYTQSHIQIINIQTGILK